MLDLLTEVRGRGHTIFLATHFLEESEQLCDRVGVLFGGKLAAEVDVQSLQAPGRRVLISVADMTQELALRLQHLSPAVRRAGREIVLEPNTPSLQAQVLRTLLDAEVPIITLVPQGRPLEEIYLRIVRGEPIEEPAAEAPPNSMFAPPGHPDAALAAPPRRPGAGDPLLNELFNQEPERDHRTDQENEV
jgi:ABC-2 type transport system ATP-binding protein